MSTHGKSRAWMEIRADALRRNLARIRASVGPGVRLVPMVKADAYGLGMAEVVSVLQELRPWGYGVAAVEEGLRLRELGVESPVLVLSPPPPASMGDAVAGGLSVCVGDVEALRRLRDAALAAKRTARFHLEVDTGMGRAGFDAHRVAEWRQGLEALLEEPLEWEGSFTHFHSADSGDEDATVAQWERFLDTVRHLPPMPEGAFLHACNSPGALRRPDFAAGAVRPGIYLYGGVAGEGLPDPAPVASLRARIVFLRDAAPGSTVGYGATHSARGQERWASVGIGYGDGLPRLLGNRGQALVRGRRVPIIGRVSMDVTVLDVSEVDGIRVGDVVTFFGEDGGETITLEEVAGHARTINYEILTGLTRRLPRTWTDDGGY